MLLIIIKQLNEHQIHITELIVPLTFVSHCIFDHFQVALTYELTVMGE